MSNTTGTLSGDFKRQSQRETLKTRLWGAAIFLASAAGAVMLGLGEQEQQKQEMRAITEIREKFNSIRACSAIHGVPLCAKALPEKIATECTQTTVTHEELTLGLSTPPFGFKIGSGISIAPKIETAQKTELVCK